MKKVLVFLVFVSLFFLVACGGSDNSDNSDNSGNSDISDNSDNSDIVDTSDVCYPNPCNDSTSGLTWSKRALNFMTWQEAVDFCNNLSYGEHSDWHLPTISELRTLIRSCPNTITGGSCRVTDDCCSFDECYDDYCRSCDNENNDESTESAFEDHSWFWSSSVESDNTDIAWSVDFTYGEVYSYYKDVSNNVRCVR